MRLLERLSPWFLEGAKTEHLSSNKSASYADRYADAEALIEGGGGDNSNGSSSEDDDDDTDEVIDESGEDNASDGEDEDDGDDAGAPPAGLGHFPPPALFGTALDAEDGEVDPDEFGDLIGLTAEVAPLLLLLKLCRKYQSSFDFSAVDHKGASLLHCAVRYGSPNACAVLLSIMAEVAAGAGESDEGANSGAHGTTDATASASGSKPTKAAKKRGGVSRYVGGKLLKAPAKKRGRKDDDKDDDEESERPRSTLWDLSRLSPSAKALSLTAVDSLGRTPLHHISPCDGLAAVQAAALLLRAGAPADQPDSFGNTPLMMAVRHRDTEDDERTAARLGIPVNVFGNTAVMRASDGEGGLLESEFKSSRNHFVLAYVRMLLQCGANSSGPAAPAVASAKHPLTPLHCCSTVLCEEVLLADGAQRTPLPPHIAARQPAPAPAPAPAVAQGPV